MCDFSEFHDIFMSMWYKMYASMWALNMSCRYSLSWHAGFWLAEQSTWVSAAVTSGWSVSLWFLGPLNTDWSFTTVPTQLSQLFIGTAQLLSVGARKPDSSRHLGSVKLNGNTSPKLCKAPVGSCVKSVWIFIRVLNFYTVMALTELPLSKPRGMQHAFCAKI